MAAKYDVIDLCGEYSVVVNSENMKYAYVKNNFLMDKSNCIDEILEPYLMEVQSKEKRPKLSTVTFLITEKCNLECVYCQVQKKYAENAGIDMNNDVIYKVFDIIQNKIDDSKLTINITGGEPLLNFNNIKTLITVAKQRYPKSRIALFTNAVCASDECCEFLRNNNVFVIVSFDGNEKIHNKTRMYADGGGSFQDALKGYYKLKSYGLTLGVSMVATDNNTEFLLSNEFIEFIKDLAPKSIGINYEHFIEKPDMKLAYKKINLYTSLMITLYEKLEKMNIYFENAERVFSAIAEQRPRGKECSALGKGITVAANGTVGPCKSLLVSKEFGFGLDRLQGIYDSEFIEWMERSTFSLNECKSCEYRGICGSGCTYDAYMIYHTIQRVDSRVCIMTKKLADYYFKRILEVVDKGRDIIIPDAEQRQLLLYKEHSDIYKSVGLY